MEGCVHFGLPREVLRFGQFARAVVALCALAALSLLVPLTARAQDVVPRIEAGGHAGVAGITFTGRAPAAGVWCDLNFAPRLALETRLTVIDWSAGDTAVHFETGVRATFVRTHRLAFYGVALPGLYRDPMSSPFILASQPGDPVITITPAGDIGTSTHFVLDIGAGLAIALTPRLLARIELIRDLHAEPLTVVTDPYRPEGPIRLTYPTFIGSEWDLHAGASLGLGPALGRPDQPWGSGRWTIGPQLGMTVSTSEALTGTVGGFAAFKLLPYFDVEASASTFVGPGLVPTQLEGGRMAQAVAGGKVGVRQGRVGVFFKIRAGVNSYSSVAQPASRPTYQRSTVPALDLGGVIEMSLSARLLMRIDVGESLSFTPSRLTLDLYSGSTQVVRQEIYSLPMRVGLGWRF